LLLPLLLPGVLLSPNLLKQKKTCCYPKRSLDCNLTTMDKFAWRYGTLIPLESLCRKRYKYIYIYIHRVSQEEYAILREGVPYVKIYRYNPKHPCPKLNGYGDNGQRKARSCVCSAHYT
jgi:hypothetical protein